MTAGQKIYNLRENAGITQAAFAERIGVNLSTVQSWENGTLPVDKNAAVLLSKAFCVNSEYFTDSKNSTVYAQPKGYCHDCGLPIYDVWKGGTRFESKDERYYTYCVCGLCKDKEQVRVAQKNREYEAAHRRKVRNTWIGIGIAVVVVVIAIAIVVAVV